VNGARHRVVTRRVLCGLAALFTLFWAGPRIFAGALILAFGVRLAYVLVRRRARVPLLSGWIFVIALGLLVVSWAGRHGRMVERSSAAAVRQGVVARKSDATPRDRCVGLFLDWWDTNAPPQDRSMGLTKPMFRVFVSRVCQRAETDRVLGDDGVVDQKALQSIWSDVWFESAGR
jgi:hypothetical protein